jgi:hypothetical protein
MASVIAWFVKALIVVALGALVFVAFTTALLVDVAATARASSLRPTRSMTRPALRHAVAGRVR